MEYTEPLNSGSLRARMVPYKSHQGISDGPTLSSSFKDACMNVEWAEEIYREYNNLVRR